jgi:tetratricopeptide (TPR) repeat protein
MAGQWAARAVAGVLACGLGAAPLLHAEGVTVADWRAIYEQAAQLSSDGQHGSALPLAERSLRMAKRLFGSHAIQTADALELLGHVHDARGRPVRALFFYQRALAIREQRLGLGHPRVADTMALLAELYASLGQAAQAEAWLTRAHASREAAAEAAASPSPVSSAGAAVQPQSSTPQSLVSLEQPRLPAPNRSTDPAARPAAVAPATGGQTATATSSSGAAAGVRVVPRPRETLEPDAARRAPAAGQRLSDQDLTLGRGSSLSVGVGETAQMRSLTLFAESLIERAVAYIQVGSFPPADELLREALAIADRLYGPRDPKALELLAPASHALQQAGRPEDVHALERRLRAAMGGGGTSSGAR